MFLNRMLENGIKESVLNFPVTAVTGPRQCGKSTLVKHILQQSSAYIYLDLEKPSDLNKLNDAEWFLTSQKNKLICIDEIQRKPDLFPLLRSLVDEWNRPGCFLILGSASRQLLKQSSESLAGRITYKRLTPFLWSELEDNFSIENYMAQGAFPRSLLVKPEISFEWRENFITTFLEKDLLQWSGFSTNTMRRLWQMVAHQNGQLINFSSLASVLGVSSPTIRNYIDLLAGTYMVELVTPFLTNTGKRTVKAPKVYISDSGITAALLNLRSFEEMIGHPAFGAIWEQIVLSNLKGRFPGAEFSFYRTSNGAETDFVMNYRSKIFAIECKASVNPSLTKGNYIAFKDINPTKTFIVSPVKQGWSMRNNIEVVSLDELSKFSF